MKKSLLLVIALVFQLTVFSQSTMWSDQIAPEQLSRQITPEAYRTLGLDVRIMGDFLMTLPSESEMEISNSSFILSLPMPDGGFQSFKVLESSVMAPELQSRFPQIRSYIGQGIDDPTATIRFDFTPAGFHAMIISESGTVYIDPLSIESNEFYISYTKEAFYRSNNRTFDELPPLVGEDFIVTPEENEQEKVWEDNPIPNQSAAASRASSGTQLRTYALALACTGEYATYHGGTVAGALAAMNTSMVRVNGVYEREVAIRMILVGNNDQLVFLNAATDPYDNGNGGAMLGQNQTTCNSIIGSANYDIGHVFSTGGGGVAYLNAPCGSLKAGGVTGQTNPVNDPFDIDYVCHEMGHQFGGNHTQNNSCNRSSGAAYEPGSATTIMGYAGICAPNPQNNSDDYFHNHSYNEIVNFSVNGNGNTCATITSTGNTPPTVDAGSGGFTIPISTPFELTAIGNDGDGDLITYNWEQYDLGPATAGGDADLTNPSGNQPIFRSWPAQVSPTRVFPRLQDLINNTIVLGEHMPTYTRNLRFRCTVRDNRAGGGGVNDDEVLFGVSATSGPFLVTQPNAFIDYPANSFQTVTWDVANTTSAPVSCSDVDIFLSLDGGFTYPITLVSGTPNDGSQSVLIPNNTTSTARIKVKASNNIFFDISNQNFTISASGSGFDYDVTISNVISPSGDYCGSEVTPEVTITNLGSVTMTSATIDFSIDGGTAVSYNWTGSLAFGQGENVVLPTQNIAGGNHSISITTYDPNGQTDEDLSNNTASSNFTITDGELTTVNFLTDCWGEEVSWTLQEENGGAIISSVAINTYDDLANYSNEYCLADGCYDLIIEDGYGDGMAGSLYACGLDGDYSVVGADSGVLVQMAAANYGFGITESFCIVISGDVLGCTNTSACNFNPLATLDDGSCILPDGCTNPTACNYNAGALCDNGSCILPDGCTNPTACNYNAAALCDNGSCILPDGCTNPTACNYNAAALCDNGSCILPDGCTNPTACNYNAAALCDNGSCILPDGCTNPTACNYNAAALCDNGSCILPDGCTNPTACNYNAAALCDNGSCILPDGCTNPTACNYNASALCDDGSCTFGTIWYEDLDGDTYGSAVTTTACNQPAGFVNVTGDCDDTEPLMFPGGAPTAQGIDNDCSGTVDPDEALPCLGDFNNDGTINISDLLILLADFGCLSSCSADISGDGTTNSGDLTQFLVYYGTNCPN